MAEKLLRISTDERWGLPLNAQTSTSLLLGGKGMGKTNLGAVIIEECAAHGLRFSVLDPLDNWWGLQHGATKDQPGLDVVILGGTHGDLPIEPTAGAVVADFVADEPVNTIIALRHATGKMWTRGEKIRFVTDYITRLYERQGERRVPLLQIIDEAGRFIPQNPNKGDAQISLCIGAIETLVEEGRNAGVGVCLITQRSARINKSVSELADMMVAFRTVGPNSVGAISDWLGEHVEREKHKELIGGLRALPIGTALVVSPGWLGHEGIVTFRERSTFDSSSTPKPGQQLRAPGKARKPDLAHYQARMAEVRERAEALDPRKLQRKIAELELALGKQRELGWLKRIHAACDSLNIEANADPAHRVGALANMARTAKPAGLADKDRAAIETALNRLKGIGADGRRLGEEIARKLMEALPAIERETHAIWSLVDRGSTTQIVPRKAEAAPKVPDWRPPAPGLHIGVDRANSPDRAVRGPRLVSAPRHGGAGNADMKPMVRKMMTALAQHPEGLTKSQIRLHTGYADSGGVSEAFALIARNGWASTDGIKLRPTQEGLDALGPIDPLPTGDDLREWLMTSEKLSKMQKALLHQICAAYPKDISKGTAREQAGYADSGGVSEAFAVLTRYGYITLMGGARVRASERLYS